MASDLSTPPDRPRQAAPFDSPDMDSESAALLRAWLCPLLERAESWVELADTLRAKGYGLAIRHGRLVLVRCDCGEPLCSLRFLGTSLRKLAARLGRPAVRALPGRQAAGELMLAPQTS
ncbi:MAG: hypothetical protein ACK5MY_03455 [Jhaorihella sp.]